MKEIVGAMIGTIITNDRQSIKVAVEAGTVREFLDRQRMKFMSACDSGVQWDRMANGPTLFCIDADGNPQRSK
jgi:hypothetical protein